MQLRVTGETDVARGEMSGLSPVNFPERRRYQLVTASAQLVTKLGMVQNHVTLVTSENRACS